MITAKNLVKTYGYVKALNDVSFEVERGEVLGFLGPNGAGKTTTMKIITGIIAPDSGSVSVGGYNIFADPLEAQKKIGYLPENNPLYYDMPVKDFIRFAAQMRNVPAKERKKKISDIVDSCNIASVMNKNISELSKGFRQRVGLAQAMIASPEILILDEPTSGLDPKQIMEIRNMVKDLGREKTVILSTHILQEVEATCTRVIIVNEGKIVASGSPEQLRQNLQGGAFTYATIRGEENVVLARLKEHPDVSSVEVLSRISDNVINYRILSGHSKDVREKVYCIVAKNNFSLLELRRDALKLEDIFLKLTAKHE